MKVGKAVDKRFFDCLHKDSVFRTDCYSKERGSRFASNGGQVDASVVETKTRRGDDINALFFRLRHDGGNKPFVCSYILVPLFEANSKVASLKRVCLTPLI